MNISQNVHLVLHKLPISQRSHDFQSENWHYLYVTMYPFFIFHIEELRFYRFFSIIPKTIGCPFCLLNYDILNYVLHHNPRRHQWTFFPNYFFLSPSLKFHLFQQCNLISLAYFWGHDFRNPFTNKIRPVDYSISTLNSPNDQEIRLSFYFEISLITEVM